MSGDKTHAQHAALMTQMAQTLGVDLDAAQSRGALPPAARSAMLSACTGCANPVACGHWLDQTASAKAAPSYCRNGDLLGRLAEQ